ncbi:MAG: hypothetical protein K2N85_15655 [Lachnospiraceae bacterium]|nr:hypothetical protein [Lachnospiraceae bacterium]
MKKRLKMLLAALGVTALVFSQNGVIQVNAEEESGNAGDVEVLEETGAEVQDDEIGGNNTNSTSLLPPTSLSWSGNGQGIFYNPNNNVYLYAAVFYVSGENQVFIGQNSFTDGEIHSAGECKYDLYHYIESYGESGDYKYNVAAVDSNGNRVISDYSDVFNYTRPSEQLPRPIVSVNESGVVSCELSNSSYTLGEDYGFYYEVYEDGTCIYSFGSNNPELNLSGDISEGHVYVIYVRTLSRDINKYLDSADTSRYVLDLRSNDSSSSESKEESNVESGSEAKTETVAEPVVEEWKPTTPDEKKRYAAYGREKAVYTADNGNAYTVTIHNAMQGKKCFDSFEAVLMDWNIGRTYNIFPSGKIIYKTNEKTRIALSIPKSLQAAGRAYKMICVTEGGQVVILEDLDSDPNTITFETDTYYAFALVYKDTVVSQ